MFDEKQQKLEELTDEVEIILSVKDDISEEEIENFVNKFPMISEYDIRKKIKEITGDDIYINSFIEEINGETRNVTEKKQTKTTDESITNETLKTDDHSYENEEREKIKKNTSNGADNVSSRNCGDRQLSDAKENLTIDKTNVNDKISENTKSKYKRITQIIFDEENIPEVLFIKADIKYGQLSLEWGWPEGINKVLICYRMDKFPVSPRDTGASKVIIEREHSLEKGDYVISRVIEGNYYFGVYTLTEREGNDLFSHGQRRLVVNKSPLEIFYGIRSKRNLLGKLKSAEINISTTSKELNLPQLVLVAKYGNMPIQKSDGETLFTVDYQTLTKDKSVSFDLPAENIGKNMYVKLFFQDDSNSKIYRIISPAKEGLYFK
jgi:hypothetical protein